MLKVVQRQTNLFYCGHYYTGRLDGKEGQLTKNSIQELSDRTENKS